MTVDLINGEKERLVQIYFQLNLTTNKIQLKRVIEAMIVYFGMQSIKKTYN